MDTKLTSMKLPARKPSTEEKMYPTMCEGGNEPEYPWGLCLNLEEQQLVALGIKTLPKVGATITIQAKGNVTSVSENETQDGTRRSVSIQITDLALD
jgi:hypothetical protein